MRRVWTCLLLLAMAVSLTVPAGAAASGLPFLDVEASSWFYPYVRDLYLQNKVNGVDETHFNPNGTVSLGEALKMILLAAGYPEQKAVDSHWASGYLSCAKARGLMPPGTFPTLDSTISRLQIAQLAVKALDLDRTGGGDPFDDTDDPAALAAYDNGIFTGVEEGNRLLFKPEGTVTRAEMSAVTWRAAQKQSEGKAGTAQTEIPQKKTGTYIQIDGREVYVSDKIPKNPYDPSLFQYNENGYLTYNSGDYTCAVGVDVSRYQGEIDWERVRDSGVDFAILRLGYRGYGSEGRLALDSSFSQNIQAAQAAGLEVTAADDKFRSLRFSVKDTGIGIRKEDIPRLFQKGFTGYNGRIDKKASGLGLYLCKNICDKLGHKISIDSEEGEGTEVSITVSKEKVHTSDLTKM